MFGPIPGYPPGSLFESRRELAESGVHRPPQAGICGSERNGAESIVLSGGYEDDEDYGDVIVYTGHGGQDKARGPQVRDQILRGGNLALVMSMNRRLPVRVIRGASTHVFDPPSRGYRYDGLYRVDRYKAKPGVSDFRVYLFRLVTYEELPQNVSEQQLQYDPAPRREERVDRIVRNREVAEAVKRLHEYRCQICGDRLETAAGPYAEAAHIRPLGPPDDGPDTIDNVLCLCPNHHVLFDQFGLAIADDFELIGFPGRLRTHPRHRIERAHVRYHRDLFHAAADD